MSFAARLSRAVVSGVRAMSTSSAGGVPVEVRGALGAGWASFLAGLPIVAARGAALPLAAAPAQAPALGIAPGQAAGPHTGAWAVVVAGAASAATPLREAAPTPALHAPHPTPHRHILRP